MISLVATYHDPHGRMVADIAQLKRTLLEDVADCTLIATRTTSAEGIAVLRQLGITVYTDGGREIGRNRHLAVQRGLLNEDSSHLIYCDFDRYLYWLVHHPDEFSAMCQELIGMEGYVAIGRTKEAWDSHPPLQKIPEEMTNQQASELLGMDVSTWDMTAGCCGMDRPMAELLVAQSIEKTNATDGEWPAIAKRANRPITCWHKDGLAFETWYFFPELESVKPTLAQVKARHQLKQDSINAVRRVFATVKASPNK